MTAAAIALLSLVIPGKDQGRRLADQCRASLPVCAAVLLASCDEKPAKEKAKPDRSALAAGGAAFVVRVDPSEERKVRGADLVQAGAIPISEANLGKPMAIIIDGEVISSPTIQGECGANFQITGSFTEADAVELASQLTNPLENPLHVEKISAIPPAAAGRK